MRGPLVGDKSILTFTRGCADFRDPTAALGSIQKEGTLSKNLQGMHDDAVMT